jgi:hypothetical protein
VIVEINAGRLAAAAVPVKDEPPLTVDTDRMAVGQVAAQLLERLLGGTRKS